MPWKLHDTFEMICLALFAFVSFIWIVRVNFVFIAPLPLCWVYMPPARYNGVQVDPQDWDEIPLTGSTVHVFVKGGVVLLLH
jgi:hypothetical protein